MSKQKLFWITLPPLVALVVEFFSIILVDYVRKTDLAELAVRYRKVTTCGLMYDTSLQLITPIPGTATYRWTPEYFDTYHANSVNGIGLYDNGISEKHRFAGVILGDSFTFGMGSLDNLGNNWVVQAERMLPNTELINLGGFSKSTYDEIRIYRKLTAIIPHQFVILNFFTGNDFDDNLIENFDFFKMVSDLGLEADALRIFCDGRVKGVYTISNEYLLHTPVKSRFIWLILKTYEQLKRTTGLGSATPYPKNISDYHRKHASDGIPPELVVLRSTATDIARFKVPTSPHNFYLNKKMVLPDYQAQADRIVDHSVSLLTGFAKQLSLNDIQLMVVIHPSKEEVYLPSIITPYTANMNLDYARQRLASGLSGTVRFLDLTDLLRKDLSKTAGLLYYPDDSHYTVAGYNFAAQHIGSWLVTQIETLPDS